VVAPPQAVRLNTAAKTAASGKDSFMVLLTEKIPP
jgi:hypothetical protein